jgi:PhzF family phenazine biosynthesis protein
MTRELEIHQVDAFTDQRFAGNPAGVVLGADALDEPTMLAIARELNNADTAFVSAPDAEDHDVRVRFFTPRAEASFVGHATLAVHAVLTRRDGPAPRRQKGRTGIVRVAPSVAGSLEIRLPRSPLGRAVEGAELLEVCGSLGIDRSLLDVACPPRIVGSGSTRLLIALAAGASLATLAPDLARLATLSPRVGAPGYFVFSRRPAVTDCTVESRMFCPALGIPEDPVSGNAHGMLGVYLDALGLLPEGRLRGAQGHHVGRPGKVDVELLPDGALALRGRTCHVFETRLAL